jgi:competence protein ComEC
MQTAAPVVAAIRRRARRHRPHVLLACLVGGLASSPGGLAAVGAWIGTVGAVAIALRAPGAGRDGGARRDSPAARTGAATTAALGVLLALAGGLAGLARIESIDRPARAAPPGTAIVARATLLEPPRATRFGTAAEMRIDSGPARGLRVMARVAFEPGWPAAAARGRPAPPGPGLRVRMRALVLRSEEADGRGPEHVTGAGSDRAEHGFDYAAFLRSRGIGREVRVESMRAIGSRAGAAGVVDAIRRRAEIGIAAGLGAERAALARGMVLGEDGGIGDQVRDDFQRSGLAHLLAASGQNVALLCALALPLLMLAGAEPRVRVAVMLALVALYVPLAGSGASIQRAGIMAAAGLVAIAAGRRASAAYALLLAAAVTLVLNPRATGDPGWQLSFAAVAGMLALGPPLRRLLSPLPRALAEPAGVTVAATLATAPLMAHQFGAVSVAALPANLLALPAVAPVMWIGMTQAALAQLGAAGGFVGLGADTLCAAAGRLSSPALGWLAATARRFADPAWAQASVDLSAAATVCAYAGVAAAVVLAERALGTAPGRDAIAVRWRTLSAGARRALIGVGAAAAAAAGVVPALPPAPTRHLTIDFIDVGQGDATLIRDPAGAAVLFDGGPPEGRVDRTLRRLGVRRLSVVVATHHSRDHHGGLMQVIRRFPVGLLLDGGDGTRDPTFTALEAEAERRGIRRVAVRAGQSFAVGALRIRILSPGPRAPGPAPADPNPRATVAIVSEANFDLFLSADAESPYLLPLELPRVEAIKVPHHGSADAGLPQLLERLRPAVAAIEVGAENPFGHPRASTLATLARHVPNVFRTDRDGTVELTVEGAAARFRTHR